MSEWIRHDDPKGFSLEHPRGWTVQTRDDLRRILVGATDRGVFVLTQPYAGDPVAWLRTVPQAMADVFPNARMGRADSSPGKPFEMIGSLEFATPNGPGKANIMCSGNAQGGVFYAMAAPVAVFDNVREALSHVLASIRFGPPNAQPNAQTPRATAPALEFTRWADPREQAFLCEVPQGWRVDGGLFRASMIDVRSELRVSAPDGSVYVQYGDRNIGPFSLPSMLGMSLGLVEGGWYSPTPGNNYFIKRYVPGAHFAQEYAQYALGQMFGSVQVQGVQDLPVTAQQGLPGSQSHRGQARVTAGGLSGTVTASTNVNSIGDGGFWYVTELEVMLGKSGAEPLAQTVASRIKNSFQVNPQWQMQQQGMTAQSSAMSSDFFRSQAQAQQQMSNTMRETSDLIQQGFNDRWQSDEERQRHFGNAIRGQTDVMDTTTGETWKVESGSQNYWRANNQNVIVGTDSTEDFTPQDFTRLKEY